MSLMMMIMLTVDVVGIGERKDELLKALSQTLAFIFIDR